MVKCTLNLRYIVAVGVPKCLWDPNDKIFYIVLPKNSRVHVGVCLDDDTFCDNVRKPPKLEDLYK
jgi:hypothetical protein